MAAVTEPPTGRRTEPGTRKIPEPITVPMTRSTRSRIRRTCRSSALGVDTAYATSVVVLVSLGIDVSFDIAIWPDVVAARCTRFSDEHAGSVFRCPAGPAKDCSGLRPGQAPVFIFQLPVHEYVLHPFRELGRILIRRPIADISRIKNGNVGEIAFLKEPATGQPFALRWKGGHFSNALFEGQQVFISHVVPQEAWHGSEGPRMGMRLKQRSVQGKLAGVKAEAGPRLL